VPAGSQQSPLDTLDPNQIPAEERRAGQPEELVAVLAPAQKYRTGHTFVAAVAFHPSGRWLVSTYRGELGELFVRVWDLATPRQVLETGVSDSRLCTIAFAPDGKTAAFGNEGFYGIHLADFQDGRLSERQAAQVPFAERPKSPSAVHTLAFTPDGGALLAAAGGFDKALRLWDVGGAALRLKSSVQLPGFVLAAALTPDGKTAAAACDDKTVRLYDLAVTPPAERAVLAHAARVHSVTFAPDGRSLAAGCADKTVWLWDLGQEPARPRAKLEGHAAEVTEVAFAPDGSLLVSGDRNARVLVWKASGEKLREWPYGVPATFAPDSRHLALSHAQSIYIVRLPGKGP
jgi:WD40 repeat protein